MTRKLRAGAAGKREAQAAVGRAVVQQTLARWGHLRCAGLVAALLVCASTAVAQDEPGTDPADASATEEGSSGFPAGLVPPSVTLEVSPEYPPTAFEAGIEADVVMQIDVTAEGRVENIVPLELTYFTYDEEGYLQEEPRALEDDPYGFVASAVGAMAGFEFAPATMPNEEGDVVAIPVQLTWRMGFVVEVSEVEVPVAVPEPEPGEGSGEGVASDRAVLPDGPVNFAGRLLERGTRLPLGEFIVAIRLPESVEGAGDEVYLETTTDLDGSFSFAGLPPGTWQVAVAESDYMPVDTTVEVSRDRITEVTYYVERDTYGQNVARVTASPLRQEVTRRTISVAEIQRIPGNNNDAIRVVQNLPGVARSSFGGGDVIIRGSAPEDTEFLIDGMAIPAVYHFGGLRAVFPSELLQEINFLPGGYSATYGRATGGVVEVTTRQDRPENIGGHVDVNVFDTGLWFEGPIGDSVFFQLGARRSYIDAVLLPLSDALELNFATAPRYYDAQARLVWDINRNHRLSILGYLSDDLLDLVQDDETGIDPEQRGGLRVQSYFNGFQIALQSQLTPTLENTFRAQLTNQGLNFSLGPGVYFELDTLEHAYRDTLTWTPSDLITLRYGLDIRVIPGDIALRLPQPPAEGQASLDFNQTEPQEIIQDFNFYQPAQFVEADIVPIDGLSLRPGFRMEYYRPPEVWGLDPRFAARYAINDAILVKGAVGRFHQDPTPAETSDGLGNPDLGLEEAIHYLVGTETRPLPWLTANVEFFYKDLRQLVSPSSDTVVRDGEVTTENYDNEGRGRVFGAEILLRADIDSRFSGWIAYTVSRSERLDSGSSEWRLFDFDQTHILTVLGTYNLPRNWSIGARFRLVSGNPTTPLIGSVYDSDSNSYVRVAGEANSIRQPAFHQLDIRIDKRWVFNRWMLNLYLDLQNAYNRRNQEDVAYSYDFSESAPITGLPIIPSFGLRAEF